MEANEQENYTKTECWQAPVDDRGETLVSGKFGFTVWYKINPSENKKLSEVIVVNKANRRIETLEDHLRCINFKEGMTGEILLEEAEKAFQLLDEQSQDNGKASNEKVTVCKYFLTNSCRFGDECFNSHVLEMADRDNDTSAILKLSQNSDENHGVQSKTNTKKHRRQALSEKVLVKKAPMKTATDVINRIQWDKQLNPDNFTVGYLDRFLGVIEKPYATFDWEDVTSLDETMLAIPRHRIQYFKYLENIVWDKRKRLDYVFGSTGSGQTILDIIEEDNNQENTIPHN